MSVTGWMQLGSACSSEVGTCLFSSIFFPFTMTPVAHRYKSNEEYVYVRGRGRGKYVCEECGIRCKKPSMLKKHIRTHTDVRPYVCKHCHFAFKTKGKRQSAGALPPLTAGSSLLGALAQSSGAQTSQPGVWGTPTSWVPQRPSSRLQTGQWHPLAAPALPLGPHTAPHLRTPPTAWRHSRTVSGFDLTSSSPLLHVSLALHPLI